MEAENEKGRKAAKREYNEAVRELVAFLRKRDKRVAARQVEEAARREERQAQDAARCERGVWCGLTVRRIFEVLS
jgi:DnaJ family protein A protein 5